jgi:hypothetical protein
VTALRKITESGAVHDKREIDAVLARRTPARLLARDEPTRPRRMWPTSSPTTSAGRRPNAIPE